MYRELRGHGNPVIDEIVTNERYLQHKKRLR